VSCLEEQATAYAENEEIGSTTYNMSRELCSADATTYYSEPHFPTRELPPIPVASHIDPHVDIDATHVKMISGIDSQISPQVSPLSGLTSSYSGLESSTREPAPVPVVYDRLVKPVYYNTNFASSEVTNGIIVDEHLSDSGFSVHSPSSASSETETTNL